MDCFLGGSDNPRCGTGDGDGDGGGTDEEEKEEARSRALADKRMKLVSTRRRMQGRAIVLQ